MVLFGFPQESVLGQITFLLYTVKLIRLIGSRGLVDQQLSADDTQIYGSSLHISTAQLQDHISSFTYAICYVKKV